MKSAVEWLMDQLETYGDPGYCKIEWETLDELIKQAKEMEKEQIKDAYRIGYINYLPTTNSEEYYNQTFKS